MGLRIGRRRCSVCTTRVLILMFVAFSMSTLLNFLCITSVCELSDSSNGVWSDFGDVVVQANEVSIPSPMGRQSNNRFNFVSNGDEKGQDPKNRKLNVAERLKLLHLTSLDLCPKEQLFASNSTIMAGRRENSVKKFVAVGIPSITRVSVSYLNKTLTSTFEAVKEDEENHVTIVVFLADSDKHERQKQANDLGKRFEKHLASGVLQIIQAPEAYYKPLENIRNTLGDDISRVTWRSKQALDYAFLMCYSSALSHYYLQLEDDVLASPSFVSKLIDFVDSHKEKWLSFNVAHLGYIGKLYASSELQNLASYIYLFYNDMPVDWLEPRWKSYRGQDPAKTETRPASLFQHIGLFSSFIYKEAQRPNSLKEKFFDQFDHKYRGLNPPAEITSNLLSHVGQPSDAYTKGDGYFWGYFGSAGTKVYQISLNDRANLNRIVVNTGSYIASTNIIIKGILEVSRHVDPTNLRQCFNFVTLGNFVLGQIDIKQYEEHVSCIRIKMRYQGRGVFFREINIWTS